MNYKVMLIRKSELVLKTQNLFTKNDLKELHVVGVEHSLSLCLVLRRLRVTTLGFCLRVIVNETHINL